MLKSIVRSAHKKLVYDRRTHVLAAKITKLIPDFASVLDVGTGDGHIASLLQTLRPDLQIEGLDVLVREHTDIPVHWFNGRSLDYNNRSVDVNMFIDVLHHTSDLGQLLAEAARVARKFVVVKDHLAENTLDHATLKFMDWIGNAPHGVSLPYNYCSQQSWLNNFIAANLELTFFDKSLSLYPPPFSYIFGRGLHFIAQLRPL